ncbi:unnamed protein product [Arabidopsis halleri]
MFSDHFTISLSSLLLYNLRKTKNKSEEKSRRLDHQIKPQSLSEGSML